MYVVQSLAERLLETDDGTVELVVLELFIDVGDTADVDDDIGAGIDLLERGQNRRQPAACDAGIGPQTQC